MKVVVISGSARAVVVARRGGSIHAFDSKNHFFFISQRIVPGSNYWNMGFGKDKGDFEKDEEGLGTMKVLGENMAYLLKQLLKTFEITSCIYFI